MKNVVKKIEFPQIKFMREVFAFMKRNEITTKEFAKGTGFCVTNLYAWRDGKQEMRISTINKIVDFIERYNSEGLA